MISAVTHGFSKKSGKPYSMVTLEDLEGSVQLLVMNDYDKFRPLLEENKAILVIGEVGTGEDKPKIFPQEIMPLEDAPRNTPSRFICACIPRICSRRILRKFRSSSPHIRANARCCCASCVQAAETVFVDTNERFNVAPSPKVAARNRRAIW